MNDNQKRRMMVVGISLVVIMMIMIALIAVMIIRNLPAAASLRAFVVKDIGDMELMDGFIVSEEEPIDESKLDGLKATDRWVHAINVDGAKCTIMAYAFSSYEDAETYYKRVTGLRSIEHGPTSYGSSGGPFGPAWYATIDENRVVYLHGDSFTEIKKVMDAFFAAGVIVDKTDN